MNFETNIPKKDAYKFNEVTSLTSVKPYVLRFWETEFSEISPEVLEDGSKLYRGRDVEIIEKVKELLFSQKLSIPEAKLILKQGDTELVCEESKLDIQSSGLKLALEKIIDSHSIDDTTNDLAKTTPKNKIHDSEEFLAQDLAQVTRETKLSDKDIVNLITAKKKLTNILGRIDEISQRHNW
jgi:DNA-binding transcriptional MerR regulator